MVYYFADRLGGINGADQAAADVLTCLRASDVPITVVCRERSRLPEQVDDINLSQVNWLRPPRYTTFPRTLHKSFFKDAVKWVLFNLQGLPLRYGVRRYLRQHKPVLAIFNDMIPSSGLAAELRKTAKLAAVVHVSPESLSYYKSVDLRPVETWTKAIAEVFDIVVFVSSRGRAEWTALVALAAKETYVIPNCCREDEVKRLFKQDRIEVRKELNIEKERFIVVCVASLQPRKGQDLLIDILPELIEAIPTLKLYLVGPGESSNWAENLRERVEEAKLSYYVNFVGPRKDAMAFTYVADVFVLPSRAEVLPISVLEAMALRVPVLASEVTGIPDMIDHNENGLLFPVGNVNELSASLKRLYSDKVLRETLAERASKTYWQHFSKAKQIKRYQAVLNEILAG